MPPLLLTFLHGFCARFAVVVLKFCRTFFADVHKTLQNFHTLCGKVTNKAGLLRQLPHKQLATRPKVWYNTAKHKISCKSNTEFL